ncbi:MAG TPA: CtpF protein, partial [Salinarimonas sp.]|nr:CtpF protein [Salinarimonas sp.]
MADTPESADRLIAPVPRVSIQAFCETPDVAATIEAAASDRRMQKTHLKVQAGGGGAALESYRHAPTPNVIVLETTRGQGDGFLGHLDALAEYCDAGTKV